MHKLQPFKYILYSKKKSFRKTYVRLFLVWLSGLNPYTCCFIRFLYWMHLFFYGSNHCTVYINVCPQSSYKCMKPLHLLKPWPLWIRGQTRTSGNIYICSKSRIKQTEYICCCVQWRMGCLRVKHLCMFECEALCVKGSRWGFWRNLRVWKKLRGGLIPMRLMTVILESETDVTLLAEWL